MVRTLACVSIVAVILCAAAMIQGPAEAQPRRAEPQSEGQAATILVEAFVVEVNVPALYEMGVSRIGQAPRAVSVANLLRCLENGQGRVMAGAKEATQDQRASKVHGTHTVYVQRDGPPPQRNYAPYEEGSTLSVWASLDSERSVQVNYELSCRIFTVRSGAEEGPPETDSWEWDGYILLTPGEPAIAAATQEGQRAVFLVLTAHVRAQ